MANKILILGHRGAAQIPENTIPSFAKALEMGADGIELDVRQTADGELVVVHPSVVNNKALNVSTYEEIRQLPDGYEVPLFKDVLKQFGKKTFLDIEFKTPGFEPKAIELIRKYVNPQKTLVSGFDTSMLNKVHDLFPEVSLGYIYNRTQDEEQWHNCPVDYVIPQFRLASREMIEEVHGEGLKVVPWTANEEPEIDRLIELGVDGIISDYPEKVVAVLNKRAGR